jgi:hypothetical protein
MPATRSWQAVIGVIAIVTVVVRPTGAAQVQALAYSPIDRPGPPLSVPAEVLAQSLSCTGDLRAPVVFPCSSCPGRG